MRFTLPTGSSEDTIVHQRRRALQQGGFSLIELLIVVAIILVIAAIAIPNFMRSRMSANEASAVSSIRAINTAQVAYNSTYPTVGYADNLTKLGAPTSGQVSSTAAGYLDWVLGCPTQPCPKSGYLFNITNVTGSPVVQGFSVTAVPQIPGSSGVRGFCSDQLGPIMFDPNGGTSCTGQVQ